MGRYADGTVAMASFGYVTETKYKRDVYAANQSDAYHTQEFNRLRSRFYEFAIPSAGDRINFETLLKLLLYIRSTFYDKATENTRTHDRDRILEHAQKLRINTGHHGTTTTTAGMHVLAIALEGLSAELGRELRSPASHANLTMLINVITQRQTDYLAELRNEPGEGRDTAFRVADQHTGITMSDA
jgi:hypothetical protein